MLSLLSERRVGIVYALVAYGMWGLLPLYLRSVRAVPPLELLAHRIVWAFALLLGILAVRRNGAWLEQLRQRPRIVWTFLLTAALLSVNWFVYIWATVRGRVVDASLGYFINPLLSVVLAVLVLRERLRRAQWVALAVALVGVLWLTILARQLPWIGLTLAVTFGCYGLLRKVAELESLAGLSLETALLLPIAAIYLLQLSHMDSSTWEKSDTSLRLLLVAAGPVTAVPLLSFAAGARRIPLSLLGVLQYLGPTLQLLLGVFVFHEPFTSAKLAGFAFIWFALALYTAEGLYTARARAAAASSNSA